jgi:hypothetical protein
MVGQPCNGFSTIHLPTLPRLFGVECPRPLDAVSATPPHIILRLRRGWIWCPSPLSISLFPSLLSYSIFTTRTSPCGVHSHCGLWLILLFVSWFCTFDMFFKARLERRRGPCSHAVALTPLGLPSLQIELRTSTRAPTFIPIRWG